MQGVRGVSQGPRSLPCTGFHVDQTMVNATFILLHDQSGVNALKRVFWEVSDPTHPKRAQYLTPLEVHNPFLSVRDSAIS